MRGRPPRGPPRGPVGEGRPPGGPVVGGRPPRVPVGGAPAEGPGRREGRVGSPKRLYKALTDYTNPRQTIQGPRNTIQSPNRLYKAPERL